MVQQWVQHCQALEDQIARERSQFESQLASLGTEGQAALQDARQELEQVLPSCCQLRNRVQARGHHCSMITWARLCCCSESVWPMYAAWWLGKAVLRNKIAMATFMNGALAMKIACHGHGITLAVLTSPPHVQALKHQQEQQDSTASRTKQTIASLTSDVSRLQQQLASSQAEATDLTASLSRATRENAQLLQQLKDSDASGERLAEQLETASRDVAEALRNAVETGKEIAQCEGVAAAADEGLRVRLEDVQGQLESERSSRAELALQCDQLHAQLQGALADLAP